MDSPWFALDCNILTNQKVSGLSDALNEKNETTVIRLIRIWSWAMLSQSEDGNITHLSNSELSDMARWKKKPDIFVNALIRCGFVDEQNGQRYLHDWLDVNGKFLKKKRKDRERKSE